MKKTISMILAAAFLGMSAPAVMAESCSVYDKYSDSRITIEVNAEKDGLYSCDGRMAVVKNGKISPFTGFAKTKKGTYCYKDGVKWTGWYKQGGRWYYFDPANDGLKALKTAKTPLGTYYLDDKGAWNGKMSALAKRPADLGFAYTFGGGGSIYILLDSFDGVIVRDAYIDDVDTERKIRISGQDMQIIYDSLMSADCDDFNETEELERAGIKLPDMTDIPYYSIRKQAGNTYSDIIFQSTVFDNELYSGSEAVRRLSKLVRFFDMYLESRPEYQDILRQENESVNAHKYDYAPFEELTRVDTISADVYKFRGFSSPGGGRGMLITSKAEMDELISMLLRENVRKSSKLIKRLSSYDDKYFEKNAVVFGDCNAGSGSVKLDDPKIYTGYSNIYIEITIRYPECSTDDECYAAAVAEVTKKELGCEDNKPNVILRRTRINHEGNEW